MSTGPARFVISKKKFTFKEKAFIDTNGDGDFSDEEKSMIRRGAVGNGMSKEAVLISWGYPPEHRTLSTKANTWLYWRNRFMKKAVDFDNNDKVINVR